MHTIHGLQKLEATLDDSRVMCLSIYDTVRDLHMFPSPKVSTRRQESNEAPWR